MRNLTERILASDPGLIRLRTAATTVLTLAVSLGVLYGVTKLAGQAFTVALLGVVVSMISSMAFKDPAGRQRALTAGTMLIIASAAVTVGALLAPHKVAGDVVFVAIMTAATAGRRLGPRATILGMVGFMTYFFSLFLGATISMVPWLIIALAIGTVVSLAISFLVTEDPDRQLRRTLRSLEARLALVLDVVIDSLLAGGGEGRHPHRLQARTAQVSEAALMADAQIAGIGGRPVWGEIDPDSVAVRLFDVELATEAVAGALRRGADSAGAGRVPEELVAAVRALRSALGQGPSPEGASPKLAHAEALAEQVRSTVAIPAGYRSVALATAELARAVERARRPPDRPREAPGRERAAGAKSGPVPSSRSAPPTSDGSVLGRLSPSSRQAVQVAIASSLAIVAGEELSSARWYWAVIAAFVIYSGTTTRGETLTKGSQRVIGTVIGVAIGAVIASLVGGNVAASMILIFVSLFAGFYLMPISYAFMVIGMSTMLALLYGLLGEFTLGLLLTRIEETAIGAAIGIATALLVLPTRTATTVAAGLRDYLRSLGELVGRAGDQLAGQYGDDLTRTARDLDRQLAALRTSARPITSSLIRPRSRASVSHVLAVLTACEHYARSVTRLVEPASRAGERPAVQCATAQVRHNLERLATMLDRRQVHSLPPAAPLLDEALSGVGAPVGAAPDRHALALLVGCLRQIDLAVVGLSDDLGPGTSGGPAGRSGAC